MDISVAPTKAERDSDDVPAKHNTKAVTVGRVQAEGLLQPKQDTRPCKVEVRLKARLAVSQGALILRNERVSKFSCRSKPRPKADLAARVRAGLTLDQSS